MPRIKLELNKDEFKKKLDIKDGKTPTKQELISIIKPLIQKPKKEVIIEKTETIKEVTNPQTGEEIVNKINELDIVPNKQIDLQHIGGLDEFMKKNYPRIIPQKGGGLEKVKTDSTLTGDGTEESPLHAVGDGIGDMLKSTYDPAGGNRQVAFILEGDSYMEYTIDGSDNITNVDYWSDNGKGTKLFSKVITWTGSNPTTIVLTDEIASKTLTTTIAYSGDTITNVTKVLS